MAKVAAVAELKANLSRYLRRVKAGEEVLVTERGVAIARLLPVTAVEHGVEQLRDLERQGLVRLGTGRLPKDFWRLPRPRDPRSAVRKGLRQERDEGW
jgi:prevent-host-death family protein